MSNYEGRGPAQATYSTGRRQLVQTGGAQTPAEAILGPIKEKVDQGRRDRARFEAVWHSNRAFAAGKQWLKTSRRDRRLVLDKRDVEGGKQRVTVDVLTQYLNTGLGQLVGVDERPQLLFRRDDLPSEEFTQVANNALQYGWDSEWRAKRQLERVKRRLVIDGTAAIQCVFDPALGKELGDVPLGDGYDIPLPTPEGEPQMVPTQQGQPILDNTHALHFVAHRQELGQRVQFKNLNEGRICWRPLSVFNLIVPPGLEDEDEFPWIVVMRAVPLDSLLQRYGDKAKGLQEEPLAALEVIGLKDAADAGLGLGSDEEDYGAPGKLAGHVALVTYFENPTREHPKGRVVNFARDRLLDVQEELPYRRPSGDWHCGISFFHYWRTEGRFWGRALIEPGKGIQRVYNKRCQQEQLTIDRGQPYLLAESNSDVQKQTGTPMEIVRFKAGTNPPAPQQGMGPGPWIWESKRGLIEDLERAMGIHGVSTGEEPSRQTTYAELALRSEKDRAKTDPITERFHASVRDLVEFSVWDIRNYWSADKVIALEGESGEAEAVAFNGQQLPEFFIFKAAEGTKPRDQASQIQLIFDLYGQAAAIAQPLPLHWLKDSIDAGRPLPLPQAQADVHLQKAEWENSQFWEGRQVEPKPYDPLDIHLPSHREAQVEAEMADRPDVVALIQQHLDASQALVEQQMQAQQQRNMASVEQAPGPGGTPSGILGQAPPPPAPAPPETGAMSG